MWSAFAKIISGTSIYYKQLNLFLFLAVVIILGLNAKTIWPYFSSSASSIVPASIAQPSFDGAVNYDIVITADGQTTVNGQAVSNPFDFKTKTDSFLLVLANNNPAPISQIAAVVHLPKATADINNTLRPQIYAVHGVESSNKVLLNDSTILFNATNIAPTAEVSIGLDFPKNYIAFTGPSYVKSQVSRLNLNTWIVLGFTLPGLTILYLLVLLLRRWRVGLGVHSVGTIVTPPSNLPPAVVGVLYSGRLANAEIAATLIDLAERGYLTLHLSLEHETVFAKGKALFGDSAKDLRPYEIFLLRQIFGHEVFKRHDQSVTSDLAATLFSNQVTWAMFNIYDTAVSFGYYTGSPNQSATRQKTIGLIMFFVGFCATLYGSLTLPEPAFILFLWVGMIIASLLIIYLAPNVPKLTPIGRKTITDWLAYRRFLTDRKPLEGSPNADFFAALPYAIALHAEKQWAKRWENSQLQIPEWYTALDTVLGAESFLTALVESINRMSVDFQSARSPGVA